MLQTEFENRVKMSVSIDEYKNIIEPMYMAADVDKDEFCRLWVKMNHKRVAAAKKEQQEAEKRVAVLDRLWSIEHKLASIKSSDALELFTEDVLSKKSVALLSKYISLKSWVECPSLSHIGGGYYVRERVYSSLWTLRKWLAGHALTKFEIA